MENPIFLYDGVCGFCNRTVQFILRRDAKERFRFASLQSEFARNALARHAVNAADLDTVYVIVDDSSGRETLLARSDAVMFVFKELGGVWRLGAWFLRGLPRGVRNWLYGLIAKHRYRLFGRFDKSPIPGERERSRFLDL